MKGCEFRHEDLCNRHTELVTLPELKLTDAALMERGRGKEKTSTLGSKLMPCAPHLMKMMLIFCRVKKLRASDSYKV